MALQSRNSILSVFIVLVDSWSQYFLILLILVYIFILIFTKRYINNQSFNAVLFGFVIRIIMLVISGNILFFFTGWDGLGLTSLWLILWYKNKKGNINAYHVFFTIRLGDALLLVSLIYWAININPFLFINIGLGIYVVLASITKSAQFPFTSWLPLAMAAPTPVSALVHSSTLVTAGIIIIIRIQDCRNLNEIPWISSISLTTALIGGFKRIIEWDLKKSIAFSTLRHCGVMMYGLSLGLTSLVFLHLCLHALIKSLLFIMAGHSLILYGGNQDTRLLGPNSPNLWVILGFMIRGVPFMGIWYSKHGLTRGWESMLLGVLTIIRFIYIIRLALLGSLRTSSVKTTTFTGTFPLFAQIIICIILIGVSIVPREAHYLIVFLLPIGIMAIILTNPLKNKVRARLLRGPQKYFARPFERLVIFSNWNSLRIWYKSYSPF